MTQTEETPAVIHKMTVHDDLPGIARKPSRIEEALEEVKSKAPAGKWVCVARYKSSVAATGAANNLRRIHGSDPAVEGWKFATRKINENGEQRTGLFVQHDATLVKPGKRAEHQKKLDEFRAKQREKAKSKSK